MVSILDIPGEVIRYVFSYLHGCDLVLCSGVCQEWWGVLQDDLMWRRVCIKEKLNGLIQHDDEDDNTTFSNYRNYAYQDNIRSYWTAGDYVVTRSQLSIPVTCIHAADNYIILAGVTCQPVVQIWQLLPKLRLLKWLLCGDWCVEIISVNMVADVILVEALNANDETILCAYRIEKTDELDLDPVVDRCALVLVGSCRSNICKVIDRFVLTACVNSSQVRLYNACSLQKHCNLELPEDLHIEVHTCVTSLTSGCLYISVVDTNKHGHIVSWTTHTQHRTFCISCGDKPVWDIWTSPDRRYLISQNYNKLTAYSGKTGNNLMKLSTALQTVSCERFSVGFEAGLIAVCQKQARHPKLSCHVFDFTGELLHVIAGEGVVGTEVYSVVDQFLVTSGGSDLCVYNLRTGSLMYCVHCTAGDNVALAMLRDYGVEPTGCLINVTRRRIVAISDGDNILHVEFKKKIP